MGTAIGAAVVALTAFALTRPEGARSNVHDHDHPHDHDNVTSGPGAGSPQGPPAPSPEPATAKGPANLAVAWWPQNFAYEPHGGDATLRFETTIANLGGDTMPIRPGDRVDYTVERSGPRGELGEVVGSGSMPLTQADVQPFPPDFGVEVGHAADTFGTTLQGVSELRPNMSEVVNAAQPVQAIELHNPGAGTFVLRQHIVRADGSADADPFDDTRLTEFRLDGEGNMLHLSSRYDGPITPQETSER